MELFFSTVSYETKSYKNTRARRSNEIKVKRRKKIWIRDSESKRARYEKKCAMQKNDGMNSSMNNYQIFIVKTCIPLIWLYGKFI